MGFACREELAIKGVNQYRHTVSMHSYHKSKLIGNGMTVASTHQLEVAISCIFYRMNKRPPANKMWTAVITVKILVG